jgi:transcriptional regulator with XRE-family HTH domain
VARKYIYQPTSCIETKPTSQSVLFRGTFINLSIVALRTNVSISHLSMIFSGRRHPSIRTAQLLAKALKMDLGSLVRALDEIQRKVGPYLARPTRQRKSKISVDKVSQGV